MKCRNCKAPLQHVFLDLGYAPPSNSYLNVDHLNSVEKFFPLKLLVCSNCWLVQTAENACGDELFRDDYAYFSSVSSFWIDHAFRYTKMITKKLKLTPDNFVIEVASNDGYLLRNFVADGIPCLGIDPAAGTCEVARKQGVPVLCEFFGSGLGKQLASEGKQADLIIGNNVYAHVPDINDFTLGLKAVLKPGGTITLEFPHLLTLLLLNQFDTVYHEHYSYLSLRVVDEVFHRAGLRVYDVEKLPTHGGSLRVYGCHASDPRPDSEQIGAIREEETAAGMQDLKIYLEFQPKAERIKDDLLLFLIEQKRQGKKVAAYGAAAKGNTLLNYAGIKPDLLPFVCDAAPSKQGKLMPGSHIPILPPSALAENRPDWVLILPWNISDEVMKQQACVREWGGRFVVSTPELEIL